MFYISLIFVIFIAVLYSVLIAAGIKNKITAFLITLFLSICSARYVILYLYYVSNSPEHLYNLKNIVLLSAASLTIVTFILIKLINDGKLSAYDCIFAAALTVIYSVIIYYAPEGITGNTVGYSLIIKKNWTYILAAVQGTLSLLFIVMSLYYYGKNKSLYKRISNILFILSYSAAIFIGTMKLLEKGYSELQIASELLILLSITYSIKMLLKNGG